MLPRDLAAARRLTHSAAGADGRASTSCATGAPRPEPVVSKDSKLVQLKTELSLGGSYAGVRAFLHSLETAPEFVVIDNVVLSREQ